MVSRANPLLEHLREGDSDRELLQRFLVTGDESAFAALVDRHGPLVRRVCRRVLGDAHLADDAVQATFLLLARKAGSLANADAVGSWLFGVARRVSLAARRGQSRVRHLNPEIDLPARDETDTERDETLRLLEEELVRMPERLRAPLIAVYLQGQTQEEAARALGWSLSTLRRRIDEAREMLRSRLGTRGASLPTVLLPALPITLRDAVLATVTGGSVPASVAALMTGGLSAWLVRSLAVTACLMLLLGVGYGAHRWFASAPPENPVAIPLPPDDPLGPLRMPELFVELLPNQAIARLGSGAFRHGTGGPTAIGDPEGVQQIEFQPDGTLVSVGGEQVRYWEPRSGRELHQESPAISTRLRWLYFARTVDRGRLLVLPDVDEQGNGKSSIALWDLIERRSRGSIVFAAHSGPHGLSVAPTSVAPGGRIFAEVSNERCWRIIRASNWCCIRARQQSGALRSMSTSRLGRGRRGWPHRRFPVAGRGRSRLCSIGRGISRPTGNC